MSDTVRHDVSVPEFIKTVLIDGIGKMVTECRLHYLSFGVISQGIEVLGNCTDELPFDEEDRSEDRFKSAITKLFPKKYHKYNKAKSEHYLYEGLRCGLTHMIRPQRMIAFTTRREALEDRNEHLKKDTVGNLILVSEDLYDDFQRACEKVIRWIEQEKLTHPKLKESYISVWDYGKKQE